jgi:hypothetical protein
MSIKPEDFNTGGVIVGALGPAYVLALIASAMFKKD